MLAGMALIMSGLGIGQWLVSLGNSFYDTFNAVPETVTTGEAGAPKFPHAVAFHGIQVFMVAAIMIKHAAIDSSAAIKRLWLVVIGYTGVLGAAMLQAILDHGLHAGRGRTPPGGVERASGFAHRRRVLLHHDPARTEIGRRHVEHGGRRRRRCRSLDRGVAGRSPRRHTPGRMGAASRARPGNRGGCDTPGTTPARGAAGEHGRRSARPDRSHRERDGGARWCRSWCGPKRSRHRRAGVPHHRADRPVSPR